MKPCFWKLSQGTEHFKYKDILETISEKLVYVHNDTGAKGKSSKTQSDDFVNSAKVGDYFYLTHGNTGIYLIGQFIGPANLFSKKTKGDDCWLDRKFRFILPATKKNSYSGPNKWWAPNQNSTFSLVPDEELELFETEILKQFFDKELKDFGIENK